ncbi:MAG: SNF2 helicase-associated domain-containing protein, partial [Saprospiraceae bacterium]|nr:SNF2 helicase-associated domain-containing protein [Saprospiraceae bacterium]
MHWYYEKRRAPKAVHGATRKQYGVTWWGQQWLKALTDIDFSNRLPRGKTYANKGLAHDLELNGNTISAKVSGSQPRPYQVRISVPKFDQQSRERLVQIVTENPLFLSKLLNRELPPELNKACADAGVHIFPRRWNDLQGDCSCPDWATPCKHMAAVLYLVANEIDKNPFVVFELHAFDLVKAFQENGYTASAGESVAIVPLAALQQEAEQHPSHIVFEEQRFAEIDFSVIPETSDSLLRLLTEKPVFYPEGNFKKTVETAYKNIVKGVYEQAKELSEEQLQALKNSENALLLLNASDGEFEAAYLFDAHEISTLEFDSVETLAGFLGALPASQVTTSAPPIRSLHLAYQFAAQLASRGAFVPQILRSKDNTYFIRFLPALLNGEVKALCERMSPLVAPGILSYVGDAAEYVPTQEDRLTALLAVFLGHFARKFGVKAEKFAVPQRELPFRLRNLRHAKPASESILPPWFFAGRPEVFDRFENREYPKSIHLWLSRFFIAEKDFVPVFEVEDREHGFEVGVSIEDRSKPFQAPVPLDKVFSVKKHAHFRLEVLRDLSMVAEFFPALNEVISSKGTQKLRFDSQAFVEVFFEALPVIRLFGIKVLLPKALQKLLRPATSMSLSTASKGKVSGTGLLSFANMLDFQWQVALGDTMLSPDDFLKLVKNMRGIVRLA